MEAKHLTPTNEQIVALSCSNVGVGPGGTTAMLAFVISFPSSPEFSFSLLHSRVSIVDFKGNVLLDTFVSPTMQVSDYRTATTGIEAAHLMSCKHSSFILYPVLLAEPGFFAPCHNS